MEKIIYFVRHCQASGQEPEAELTATGVVQSQKLANFFQDKPIDSIVSSPYVRAVQTIAPFADTKGIKIVKDERLAERVLTATPNPNWLQMLEESFHDLELCFDGGESSKEAMERGVAVIHELVEGSGNNIVVVTHGNLLALLLKYFDSKVGFQEWKSLSNPDVYKVTIHDDYNNIERVWNE